MRDNRTDLYLNRDLPKVYHKHSIRIMQPIYSTNDLRNIAFEPINDRFSKGIYLGIEVTIDMTTGYVNGSHLVSQVKTKGGEPKQYKNWRRSAKAESFITFLSAHIRADRMTTEIVDVDNELKGTYVHPQLIPHLAQWASDEFAYKVGIILNDKVINDALSEKNKEIKDRDDKIDLLIAESRDQSRRIDELLGYAIETKEEVCKANEINERVQDQLEIVQEKLGIAVEDRVPKDHDDGRNEVLVFFSNKDNEKLIKVTRRQKRNMPGAVRSLKSQGYHMQLYISEDPNTVNIWNRVRDSLPSRIGMRKSPFVVELAKNAEPKDLFDYMLFVAEEKRVV